MQAFLAQHWLEITIALLGLVAGGLVLKLRSHRQAGSSNYVDQSNVRTRGDVVGRDKIIHPDKED